MFSDYNEIKLEINNTKDSEKNLQMQMQIA
jgi:hypothetical protein